MITVVEAVYEDVCLRFPEPLPLREHTRVSVSISPLDDQSERDEWLAQSERRLRELWDNKADDVYNELLVPWRGPAAGSLRRPEKVRAAVVIGSGTYPGDLFVVPITSQLPNTDFPLQDWRSSGLNVPSGVKGQICTVEDRLVRKVTGHISTRDALSLSTHLREWLHL